MTLQQKLFSIGLSCTVSVVMFLTTGARGANRMEVPDPSTMLALVPAAAEAGAPPCIKTGTRLTYYAMTSSGESYNVVNVGYIKDQIAQLTSKIYIVDPITKKCMFSKGFGIVGHAGCAGDYWIHPDVLKQVQEADEQEMSIVRMPYTVGGKRYNAIRFQNENDTGFQAYMYDTETGLMIYYRSQTQGQPTYGIFGQDNTQMFTGWIVEVKDIDVPWKHAVTPDWVGRFKQLSYNGVQTTLTAAIGTKMDRPMMSTLTPKARGPGWVRYTNHIVIESLPGMPPEEALQEGASGSASIGGLWIPPEAMANLRPGQVIESNNLVGTTNTISEVRPNFVILSEIGTLHRIDCTYDARTGILSAMTFTQQVAMSTMSQSLRLVGQQ